MDTFLVLWAIGVWPLYFWGLFKGHTAKEMLFATLFVFLGCNFALGTLGVSTLGTIFAVLMMFGSAFYTYFLWIVATE